LWITWIRSASSFLFLELEPKNGIIAFMFISMRMLPSMTKGSLTQMTFSEHGNAFASGGYPVLVGTRIEIALFKNGIVYPCSQERWIYS